MWTQVSAYNKFDTDASRSTAWRKAWMTLKMSKTTINQRGLTMSHRELIGVHIYDIWDSGYTIVVVCRVWWEVVIHECPSLWACARVDISQGSTNCVHFVFLMTMFLARSHNWPLDIHFRASRDEVDTASVGVLELLLGESAHWWSAYLSLMIYHLPVLASHCNVHPPPCILPSFNGRVVRYGHSRMPPASFTWWHPGLHLQLWLSIPMHVWWLSKTLTK